METIEICLMVIFAILDIATICYYLKTSITVSSDGIMLKKGNYFGLQLLIALFTSIVIGVFCLYFGIETNPIKTLFGVCVLVAILSLAILIVGSLNESR